MRQLAALFRIVFLVYHVFMIIERVVVNPKILAGKPIIKGTRVPVTLILNLLVHGYTVERILEAYPNLKKADITAAVRYSEMRINRETVEPIISPA